MASSPIDNVIVQAFGVPGVEGQRADFNFANFTSFELSNSITEPAEASFEMGDETGWQRLAEFIGLGAQFMVFVNDRIRLTGRVHQLNSPLDASQGATQRFVIRGAMADAQYSSAPQTLRLRNASIREFILALYDDLGLTEFDFDFRGDVSRNLMTGKNTRNQKPPIALDDLTIEQAKTTPPESIYTAADRHLRRHGMLHWDGPDGKIVVAAPDDQQAPLTQLRSFRGRDAQINNLISVQRSQDVSGAPTVLGMFGVGGKVGFSRAKVSSVIINEELVRRGFNRKALILDEGIRTTSIADRRARREFALRNRGLDRFEVTLDGLSYRDGSETIPWSPDTTTDVVIEDMGGFLGSYYIEAVRLSRSAASGDVASLSIVRQNVWTL